MPNNRPSGNNDIVEPIILMSDRRGVVVTLQANADWRRPQELQKIRCIVWIIESRSHYWSQRQNAERHVTSGVRGNVVPTKQEKNKAIQKFLSANGKIPVPVM